MEVRQVPSKLLNDAGIFEKYHEATFAAFVGNKKVVPILQGYMDTVDGRGVYLVGSNGVGKSYLVAAAFIELMRRGLPAYRVHAQTLLEWYIKGNNEKMRKVAQAYFLCIDDFGKEHFDSEKASALASKCWDAILRWRVERKKPTWFTSNVPAEDIRKMYGDSIASLIMEAADVVILTGKDERKKHFKIIEI